MKYIAFLILLFTGRLFAQSGWTPHMDSLVHSYESQFHLPHGIARAFNLKENSGKLGASAEPRVEGGFFNEGERHYKQVYRMASQFFQDNPEMRDSIPFDVERFQESTSWGGWQLMGFNLRALGCKRKYLADITDEEHAYYWALFFSGYMKRYKPLSHAISMYNGAKAPASYARDILKYLKRFTW